MITLDESTVLRDCGCVDGGRACRTFRATSIKTQRPNFQQLYSFIFKGHLVTAIYPLWLGRILFRFSLRLIFSSFLRVFKSFAKRIFLNLIVHAGRLVQSGMCDTNARLAIIMQKCHPDLHCGAEIFSVLVKIIIYSQLISLPCNLRVLTFCWFWVTFMYAT